MKTSLQNLSHEKLLTCDMGQLVPVTVMDVAPGDLFRANTSCLLRTQPLLAPVMHKVDVSIHHFFVPYRLCWDEFEDFMTGGDDGTATPAVPKIDFSVRGAVAESDLANYMGLPVGCDASVDAMKFRAYNLIFNDWYRDEQLVTPLAVSKASGTDATTEIDLQNGAWFRDYFTAARPQPQLGSEVTIPLTGDAPIIGIGARNQTYTSGPEAVYETDGSSTTPYADWKHTDGAAAFAVEEDPNNPGYPNIRADLSDVSAVDIEELRFASALQRFKEKLNRGGSRYTEFLKNMFSVRPQDSRLQNPQYLGGGNQTIQFSEVLQTAEGTDPVGELRGHGISAGRSNRYKFYAPEFGCIISLLCVRPKTVYAQGINRMWSRDTKYDYLIPDFANLGDQEILNKEIYYNHSQPDGTFGFTPRYDDFRYIPNTICGEFTSTLAFWSLFRNFGSEPSLNSDFVTSNPSDRIYATDAAQLQIRAINSVKAKRRLPKHASPRLF